MTQELDREVTYIPAIGEYDGQADYIWGDVIRPDSIIDTIIIHSMFQSELHGSEQFSPQECVNLLISYGFSTHYLIGRSGEIIQSVHRATQAWHAGKSRMPQPDGREKVGRFSIGIEMIGNKEDGFTEKQYESLAWVVSQLMITLPITNILGHSDIAGPDVRNGPNEEPKTDPWHFDWQLFFTYLEAQIGNVRMSELKLVGEN